MPNITITQSTGGSVSQTGVVAVDSGADFTLNISASEGYVINDILVDLSSVSIKTEIVLLNIISDVTIDVAFIEGYYDVTEPMATAYFNKTLRASSWSTVTLATEALYDAGQDISALIGRDRPYILEKEVTLEALEFSHEVKAICEWALFLIENPSVISSALATKATNVLKSVIVGVGSEEYSATPLSSRDSLVRRFIMQSQAGKFIKMIIGNPKVIR